MPTPVICPLCQVNCRIELNGTLVAHPSETGCALDGRTFSKVRVKEDDKRPTWPEVCEKYKGKIGLPDVDTPELPLRAEPEAPVVAEPEAPAMPEFPAPPPVMPEAATE